jgi:hypothetical protein
MNINRFSNRHYIIPIEQNQFIASVKIYVEKVFLVLLFQMNTQNNKSIQTLFYGQLTVYLKLSVNFAT